MKKSFATAKRVISGMEKMSMNCFTFGPCDRKYISMFDISFCMFMRNAVNACELVQLTLFYLWYLDDFLIPFKKPLLTKRLPWKLSQVSKWDWNHTKTNLDNCRKENNKTWRLTSCSRKAHQIVWAWFKTSESKLLLISKQVRLAFVTVRLYRDFSFSWRMECSL